MHNKFAGDLKFIGLSEDSEQLIVVAPNGEQYRLRITPMLRAAIRLDRSAMEAAKADHEGALPPREIQARIRSGLTAQEISAKSNVPLEYVHRYEGPVLAERQFVAENAQKVRLSSEPDSPTLGQIVIDRLASRKVNTLDLAWDAYKSAGHGWIVTVTFDLDNDIRVARWMYKASAKTVTAIDEDSKWLSETRISDEPIPRRHLAAVQEAVFDIEAVTTRPVTPSAPSPSGATEDILDRLNSVRGTRTPVALDGNAVEPTPLRHAEGRVYSLPRSPHRTPGGSDVVYDQVAEPDTTPASAHSAVSSLSALSAPDAADADGPDRTPSEETTRRNPSPWAPEGRAPMTSALSALSSAQLSGAPALLSNDQGSERETRTNEPTAEDDRDLLGEQIDTKHLSATAKKSKNRGRSPMPTWDEIMFGAKPE